MRSLRGERGSTSVLILGLSVAALIGVGFAVDATRKGQAYSEVTSIAEEAARAGDQALRVSALAAGTEADVEPDLAAAEARRYVASAGATGMVHVDNGRIVVDTTIVRQTVFLGVIGIGEFTVHGHGVAVLASAG